MTTKSRHFCEFQSGTPWISSHTVKLQEKRKYMAIIEKFVVNKRANKASQKGYSLRNEFPKDFGGLTELLGSRSVSDKNTKAIQASCRPIQLEDLCTNTMPPLSLQWACRCLLLMSHHAKSQSKIDEKVLFFSAGYVVFHSSNFILGLPSRSIFRIQLSIWWLQG